MMSGGLGVGNIANMAQALLQLPNDFQIIALAGKNQKMLLELQTLAAQYPERLFAMGFTKTIERLMAVSDLAITKPGGLTSSECLAMHLPMIAVSPIPRPRRTQCGLFIRVWGGAKSRRYSSTMLQGAKADAKPRATQYDA